MKERKSLETEMTLVFGEKIKDLSLEVQEIFVDDMITAFESRMAVLCKATTEGKGNTL